MKPLRSKLKAIARRRSGLSNGGALRLMSRLLLTLLGLSSQTASGTWVFTSLSNGIVTW
jgi:hypothetical protein